MDFDFSTINLVAVAVAAVATFFLGALWYTVLFGKLWIKLNGYTEEKVKEMQARRPPPVFFGLLLVCYFILALVMASLVTVFKIDTALTGAALGFLLWLGPAAAIQMTGYLSSDRSMGVYLIDIAYQFIYLIMMGAILGAWR
jgi:hypothetical protein